jgi:hypothetical protein
MFRWLSKVFPWKKIKALQEENDQLKDRLVERQEAINKTNAYWKRRFNEATRKKS